MFQGFTGLCEQFLTKHPGYFTTSVQISESAIEKYFSQLKYAARGQLSAINYETTQAVVEWTRQLWLNGSTLVLDRGSNMT